MVGRTIRVCAALVAGTLLAAPGSVPTPRSMGEGGFEFIGVNLAGAEFGSTNVWNDDGSGRVRIGQYGVDYTYPTADEIAYFRRHGMNIARVPFLIERLQIEPFGPLRPAELLRLDRVVAAAGEHGMTVLLDPHNYGHMWAHPIGSPDAPDAAFADFWHRLAAHYADVPHVVFGLMNEPHKQSPAAWAVSCNLAIRAIRAAERAGITHQINAPGTYYQNGASYVRQGNSDRFAEAIVDSGKRVVFEIHQYNDPEHRGADVPAVSADTGVLRLTEVTRWARGRGVKLFLGEFGGLDDALSLAALENMLNFMLDNSDVWQGATQWAAGPWWPPSFAYRLEPVAGAMSPQMALLARYGRNAPR